MSKFQITPKQMWYFMENYNRGQYHHERLGQAFVNEFLVDHPDPELFFEEDLSRAEAIITERYVNWPRER